MTNESKLRDDIGFTPHKGQLDVLKCKERELVICAGRRRGKSAICAYLALLMLLEKDKNILIVAPTSDLTRKVFDYVVRWYLMINPKGSKGVSYRPYPKIYAPLG